MSALCNGKKPIQRNKPVFRIHVVVATKARVVFFNIRLKRVLKPVCSPLCFLGKGVGKI